MRWCAALAPESRAKASAWVRTPPGPGWAEQTFAFQRLPGDHGAVVVVAHAALFFADPLVRRFAFSAIPDEHRRPFNSHPIENGYVTHCSLRLVDPGGDAPADCKAPPPGPNGRTVTPRPVGTANAKRLGGERVAAYAAPRFGARIPANPRAIRDVPRRRRATIPARPRTATAQRTSVLIFCARWTWFVPPARYDALRGTIAPRGRS